MRHKIGIYVRVSTEEQAQVADGSIESQQHRIKSFIDIKRLQEKDWGKVVDTYIDDGYSAKSTNRPAYQRMIRDLKLGKINLILITDLSRLSRNISDFCELYKELGKYKANFLSIKEQFDTSTPVGEMMVFNMVNLAQFERKQTSERIAMNFHSRALRGLVNGGSPLLGYDRDPDNAGKRIVNPDEAALVKEIFKMYDDGQSLSQITDHLTKEGQVRKGMDSNRYRHINDGRWTVRVVQALLKNYAYIGQREVNVRNKDEEQAYLKAWQQYQIVPASWEAIIDKELFFKVQKRLEVAAQLERQRFDNGDKRIFFVSGMIRCGHCGRALIGQSAHGRKQIHRYYGHKQLINEKITCPVKRYSAEEIEETILKHLDKVLAETGYLDQIESNIEQCLGVNSSNQKARKDIVKKAITKIDGEIESVFKLATSMKSGSAGSDLIQSKLEKLAEKKKEMEKELELAVQCEVNLSVSSSAKAVIKSNIMALKAAMKKGQPHFKKRLFGNLFNQLLVTENGIKVFYELEEQSNLNGSERQKKKPSDSKSDGISIFTKSLFSQPLGFLVSNGSPVVTVGGRGAQLSTPPLKLNIPHDIIKFFPKSQERIFEVSAPLYEAGYTLREIESNTGFAKTSIRQALTSSGLTLRVGNRKPTAKAKRATQASPPVQRYGYARLEGQLVKDPQEYKNVLQILKLWQSGKSLTAIANHLNDRKIPPRRGKRWHHETVHQIIKHENQNKEN